MAITNKVTRADKVWAGTGGLLGLLSQPAVSGSGIGVAIIDSGIAHHAALGGRVVARINLVSHEPGVTGDPFGHGTHIAGIIGGSAAAAARVTSAYAGGSAPGVHFVDVRVLGSNGAGYTSDVIAGIDWTIANARRYGVRVINLSLGHPVSEPAATDPLCRAVARAVRAGLVVVVSAGNYGQTATGTPVLGGITSPGNSPFAITVGALDAESARSIAPTIPSPPTARVARRDSTLRSSRTSSRRAPASSRSKPGIVAERALPLVAHRRQRAERLLPVERHQHVDRGRERRRRAAAARRTPGLTPAQVKIALQTGARFMPDAGPRWRRSRQRQLRGVAAADAGRAGWSARSSRCDEPPWPVGRG